MRCAERHIRLRDGRDCLLRSPGPADAEAMLAYMRLTAGETPYMLRFPEEVRTTLPEEAEFLTRLLCAGDELMVAAFVDGALVGNAAVSPVSPYRKTDHRATLGIAVARAYWGLGIGGALVEALAEEAAALGYTQLELDTFAGNQRAQRLYAAHGFREWGRRPRAFRLAEGEYQDGVEMLRRLN